MVDCLGCIIVDIQYLKSVYKNGSCDYDRECRKFVQCVQFQVYIGVEFRMSSCEKYKYHVELDWFKVL